MSALASAIDRYIFIGKRKLSISQKTFLRYQYCRLTWRLCLTESYCPSFSIIWSLMKAFKMFFLEQSKKKTNLDEFKPFFLGGGGLTRETFEANFFFFCCSTQKLLGWHKVAKNDQKRIFSRKLIGTVAWEKVKKWGGWKIRKHPIRASPRQTTLRQMTWRWTTLPLVMTSFWLTRHYT